MVNGSGFEMSTSQAIDRHGHVFLVAVMKGTFEIPADPNEQPITAESQLPIYAADLFAGEPGLSATLVESDFSFRKRKCDVVLVGEAYAPGGNAVESLNVGFEIAECKKSARVVGPRKWIKSGQKIVVGESDPFTSMPITYGQSYGGIWQSDDEKIYECYDSNPIGIGYAKADPTRLEGMAAPTIESLGQPIDSASQAYQPWAFGPIGRNCQPRTKYAGTYDQHWQDEVFPLQPSDFDDRFYQCVPEDQQIEFPTGGEAVVLHNLHPEQAQLRFSLPAELSMPMAILTHSNKQFTTTPVVDTIVIEPAERRFSLTWRANMQLQRSIREVSIVACGTICKKWWAAQVFGADACSCDGIDSNEERLASLSELI
jgi:hypothetical protein